MTEDERAREFDDREALLDEREAVLDALQASLDRVEDGHAAACANAEQARDQSRRIRLRSQRIREASRQVRLRKVKAGATWRGVHPLGAEFAALADRLLAGADPHQTIRHVERSATRLVPGAVVASVTMLDPEGRFHTPDPTDPLAARLGEAQSEAGEGPSADATRPDGPKIARCDDLAAADAPWPRFAPAAVELGVRSVVAVGLLPLSETSLGALQLYGRDPGALDDADVDVAVVLASYLAVALISSTQLDRSHEQVSHLRQALESRDVIGQAKGLLMAQRDLTAAQAFELLSAASQRLNLKLRDLAELVVRNRRL